jgi:hypothetical protein
MTGHWSSGRRGAAVFVIAVLVCGTTRVAHGQGQIADAVSRAANVAGERDTASLAIDSRGSRSASSRVTVTTKTPKRPSARPCRSSSASNRAPNTSWPARGEAAVSFCL